MDLHNALFIVLAILITVSVHGEESTCGAGSPPTLPPGCSCPGSDPSMLECVCGMNTKLYQLPAAAELPSHVTTIIFLNCRFEVITHVPYTQVQNLHIRNSGVSSIQDGAFTSLTQLSVLDLSNNELRNVTKETFSGLASLTVLVAARNNLKRLGSDVLQNLPKLEKVEFSNNPGLELPEGIFDSNPNLRSIQIRKCSLDAIPQAVTKVTGLVELDVDLNPVQTLGKHALSPLTNLQVLGMDSCALDAIHNEAFYGLNQLTSLNLGYNNIHRIDPGLFHPFRNTLKYLYLEANQLQSLSQDILDWEQVKEVHLDHNPWICDCSIHWMGTTLKEKHDNENVTCWLPTLFQGLSVYNVTLYMSCPHEGSTSSAVALGIVIPIILVCCLLIGYFLYKIVRNRRQNQHKTVRYSAVYKDTVESAKFKPDF